MPRCASILYELLLFILLINKDLFENISGLSGKCDYSQDKDCTSDQHYEQNCDDAWKFIPKFTSKEFKFNIRRRTKPIVDEIVGKLTLVKSSNPFIPCDKLRFTLKNHTYGLPLYLNSNTGVLRASSLLFNMLKDEPLSMIATVESVNYKNISDTTLIIISWEEAYLNNENNSALYSNEQYPFNEEENQITKLKRVVRATNTVNVIDFEFTRDDIRPTENICYGQAWSVTARIIFPPGVHNVDIELFGPRNISNYFGYVKLFGNLFIGQKVKLGNLKNVTDPQVEVNLADPTQFRQMKLKLENVEVTDQTGGAYDQFCIDLNFAVILWKKDGLIPEGKLNAGVVLQSKDTVWVGLLTLVYSETCPTLLSEISISSCPKVTIPTDITVVTAEVYLPILIEDYTFSVYSIGNSVTISYLDLQKGEGLTKYAPKSVIQSTHEEVLSNSVITKRIDIFVKELRNIYGLIYSAPRESKIVKLVAHIQITDKPSSRAMISFRVQTSNNKVIFKECSIPIIADYKVLYGNLMSYEVDNTSAPVEVEKIGELKFKIRFSPMSKQVYAIKLKFANIVLGEICYTTIVDIGSGLKDKLSRMRLYTIYSMHGMNKLRSEATVYLGLIDNPTNQTTGYFIKLNVKIKSRHAESSLDLSDTYIHTDLILHSGQKQSISVPFKITKHQPERIPSNKNPVATLTIRNPTAKIPLDGYYITLFGIIMCYVGLIELPSVYIQSASMNNSDKSMTVKYTIEINKSTPFTINLDILFGDENTSQQIPFVPSNYTPAPELAVTQQPIGSLHSLLISRADNYLHPHSFTIIMASMVVSPTARQHYTIEVETSKVTKGVQMFEPKILDTGLMVTPYKFQYSVINNTAHVDFGDLQFDDIHVLEGSITKNEPTSINVIIPLNIHSVVTNPIDLKLVIFGGNHTYKTPFKFNIGAMKTGPSSVITSVSYQIDSINPDKLPDNYEFPVTPGEIGRIYNQIHLNLPKCDEYQITISTVDSFSWPVDIIDIIILDVSDYIWISNFSDYQVIKSSRLGSVTIDEASVNLDLCAPEGFGNDVRIDVFIRPWARNNNTILGSEKTVRVNGNVKIKSIRTNFDIDSVDFVVSPEISMEQYTYQNNKSSGDRQMLKISAHTTDNLNREPGEITKITFYIQLPEYSKLPNCSVTFSSGYSSIYNESEMTILSVDVEPKGIFQTSEKFQVEYSSKYHNGQQDTASVLFGNLVNPGSFNGRLQNIITVSATVRISDSKTTNNGSKVKLTMISKFGNLTDTTDIFQTVRRSGNERANISMSLQEIYEVGKYKVAYGDGDILKLNLKMKMEQNSSLECSRQVLNIYPGTNVKNVEISSNTSVLYSTVQNTKHTWLFQFQGGPFRFDSKVSLEIRVYFKDEIMLPPQKKMAQYNVLAELVCISVNRFIHVNAHVSRYLGKITVTLADKTVINGTTPRCDNVMKLAERSNADSCQVNSFITHDTVRRSQLDPHILNQSIIILFDKLVFVSRIVLSSLDSNNKIKKLNISTTTNGISFNNILTMENSTTELEFENTHFAPLLGTRGLHLVAAEAENSKQKINFTAKVYGCKATADPLKFDPCSTKFIEGSNENKPLKTILTSNEILFFCDTSSVNIGSITNEKRCFMITGSAPTTVTDMGWKITDVIMFLKPSNIIVGRNSYNNSTLISEDMGKSWLVINQWKLKQILLQSTEVTNSYDTPWFSIQNISSEDFTNMLCNSEKNDAWKCKYFDYYSSHYFEAINVTSMQILVTRSDAATNSLCPTEVIALSVQLSVPAGTTTITVEVFAPTKNSIFYGFVEFIDISYIGVRISTKNFSVNIQNTSVENVYEYKNTYTAINLSNITVEDIPNVVENYSLTLRFAVGLWNDSSILDGMKFVCKCQASDGISIITSMTNITSLKNCPVYKPELNILSDFTNIIPGDILLFQAEAYFTFETGNYTFSVYAIGQSSTISNFEVILGNGMSYADGYEKWEYEDEVVTTGILTKQIDVKINELRNKNARATYLSKSNRSVKLNAYIQATTFASTRSIVGFRLRYSPADAIFNEIQIPVIANYTSFKNVSNLTFNFSLTSDVAEVEKFIEAFFTLNLPPLSKQIYTVEVGYDNVSLGELCHSTVTGVGSGIKNRIIGMRLYTDFVIQNIIIFRRMALVNLGVLENPTTDSTNYRIEFKMILRPSVNQAYPTVSMTTINARVLITGIPTKLQTVAFSIINNPISPITKRDSLPSVYVVPSEYKYDNVLLIKYSVRIVGGISFTVKLDVTTGDYTVTRQVNFSPIPAKSPPQLVSYLKICFGLLLAFNLA
ncbi:hypothetical protein MN116_006173 [Schistosoma mekongi]|uniref:Uncharacterized protein n=1 Tax=Schistosoma mekongi TaxID=38744 RepID=A0AAE1ZBF7_SCHME|nr:hypothetical protein MN116_006173 [Schistosoma mekongi]